MVMVDEMESEPATKVRGVSGLRAGISKSADWACTSPSCFCRSVSGCRFSVPYGMTSVFVEPSVRSTSRWGACAGINFVGAGPGLVEHPQDIAEIGAVSQHETRMTMPTPQQLRIGGRSTLLSDQQ